MALNNAIYPIKARPEEPTSPPLNDSTFQGPPDQRECRDVIVLVIFLAFTGGMGFITYTALQHGNPNRLIYGVDSWGNICNQGNNKIQNISLSGLDHSDKPNLFYFSDNVFASVLDASAVSVQSVKICVSTCPPETIESVIELKNFSIIYKTKLCRYDVPLDEYHSGSEDGHGRCPPLPIQEQQVFIFRCTPKALTRRIDHIISALNSLFNLIDDNFIEKCVNDVTVSWREICGLCAISVAVGFFIVLFLRFVAGIIIWIVCVSMTLGTLAATCFAWYNYYHLKTEYEALPEAKRSVLDASRIRDWLIGSICITIATVIVILIFLVMRKHIGLVIQLFKEAGKAIADVPSLLIQPFITVIFLAGFVLVLGWIALYIETAGHSVIEQTSGYVKFVLDDYFKGLRWYHIIGFIWFIQFTIACHKITVAGAVGSWYFTRDKSTLTLPVLQSVKRLIRYHLGSAAFGSLLVTFVIFIRLVLQLVERRLKGRTHPIASFLLKCFSCCLWCFEKFLKFINTNAYIEIALFGHSFCKSARAAFLVIVNNALRLATINSLGDFVLFLGKIAAVAVVAIIGMEIVAKKTDVCYPWVPTTLACIFAYFISSCFLSVYEMAIDTIFICFCEDCAMNDGLQRRYYMSVGLMNFVQNSLKRQNGMGNVFENPVPTAS